MNNRLTRFRHPLVVKNLKNFGTLKKRSSRTQSITGVKGVRTRRKWLPHLLFFKDKEIETKFRINALNRSEVFIFILLGTIGFIGLYAFFYTLPMQLYQNSLTTDYIFYYLSNAMVLPYLIFCAILITRRILIYKRLCLWLTENMKLYELIVSICLVYSVCTINYAALVDRSSKGIPMDSFAVGVLLYAYSLHLPFLPWAFSIAIFTLYQVIAFYVIDAYFHFGYANGYVKGLNAVCSIWNSLLLLVCTGVFVFYREMHDRNNFMAVHQYRQKGRDLRETKIVGELFIRNLLPSKYVQRLIDYLRESNREFLSPEEKQDRLRVLTPSSSSSLNLSKLSSEDDNSSHDISSEMLKRNGLVFCDYTQEAVLVATDIINFSKLCASPGISPSDIVSFLNFHFGVLESISENFGFTKAVTNGDSFVCFKSNPSVEELEDELSYEVEDVCESEKRGVNHEELKRDKAKKQLAMSAIDLGLHSLNFIQFYNELDNNVSTFPKHELRVGIAFGSFYVYLMGKIRFIFDCFGEALEKGSFLEQHGKADCLHSCDRMHAICRHSEPKILFTKSELKLSVPHTGEEMESFFVHRKECISSVVFECTDFQSHLDSYLTNSFAANNNNNNSSSDHSSSSDSCLSGLDTKLESLRSNTSIPVGIDSEDPLLNNSEESGDHGTLIHEEDTDGLHRNFYSLPKSFHWLLNTKFGRKVCRIRLFTLRKWLSSHKLIERERKTMHLVHFICYILLIATGTFFVHWDDYFQNKTKLDWCRGSYYCHIIWVLFGTFFLAFIVLGGFLWGFNRIVVQSRKVAIVRMFFVAVYLALVPVNFFFLLLVSERQFYKMQLPYMLYSAYVFFEYMPLSYILPVLSCCYIVFVLNIPRFIHQRNQFGLDELMEMGANIWMVVIPTLVNMFRTKKTNDYCHTLALLEFRNRRYSLSVKQNRKIVRSIIPKLVLRDFVKSFKAGHMDPLYVVDEGVVIFVDITGKKTICEQSVEVLAEVIGRLDLFCHELKLCKIKSSHGKYLAVAGVTKLTGARKVEKEKLSAVRLEEILRRSIDFTLLTRCYLNSMFAGGSGFKIGLTVGSFVCSILGKKNLLFDCVGSTVNFCCRLCDTSELHRIQVDERVIEVMKHRYQFEDRAEMVNLKGFGPTRTGFLEGPLENENDEKPVSKLRRYSLSVQ